MRHVLALLLAIAFLAIGADPAHALKPVMREGWTVGVAYGPGRAQIAGADSLDIGSLKGLAQSIRVGRMFGSRFRIGYEHQAWVREQGLYDLKLRAGTQLEALGVTAFLARPGSAWDGLFVAVGAGRAHCRLTLLEPLAPGESAIGDTYEVVFKQDEFGWGGYGALGYDLQITRHFAAGLMASYNYLDIGGSLFDTVQFTPVVANLNWSW
jgi:hypothetical protein